MDKKGLYLLLVAAGFLFLKWKYNDDTMDLSLAHNPIITNKNKPTASTGPLEIGDNADTPNPLEENREPTETESARPSILKINEPPSVVVPSDPSNVKQNILFETSDSNSEHVILGAILKSHKKPLFEKKSNHSRNVTPGKIKIYNARYSIKRDL